MATAAAVFALAGCGHNPYGMNASLTDRECMARVMYFESNRSSEDGMLAVGTVVMNRLQSSRYPKTICGVVGQQNQFADGALSKPVESRSYARALKVADAVIGGDRHDGVGAAMFFHTAGYTFPYRNMAYVTAAGGNVFYEKKTPGTFTPIHPATLVARAEPGAAPPARIVLARVEDAPARPHARGNEDRDEDEDRGRGHVRRGGADDAGKAFARTPGHGRIALARSSREEPRARPDDSRTRTAAKANGGGTLSGRDGRIRLASLDKDVIADAVAQRTSTAKGGPKTQAAKVEPPSRPERGKPVAEAGKRPSGKPAVGSEPHDGRRAKSAAALLAAPSKAQQPPARKLPKAQ